MNFLAHCALAQEACRRWQGTPELQGGLLAGAIFSDFAKGPVSSSIPVALQAGIRLHRRIDAYSNTHETIREICASFPTELRRFAPIFVDILSDYYLSRSWGDYYEESRVVLSARVYAACNEHISGLDKSRSVSIARFTQYMQETDLLANYHQWRHVERGLHSVLGRLGKSELFNEVVASAKAQGNSGESAFRIYFGDMQNQLPQWISIIATK